MRINTYDDILRAAKTLPEKRTLAVARADDEAVLSAVAQARRAGMVDAILTGNIDALRAGLAALGEKEADYTLIDTPDDETAAREAVRLVREGRADALMKGLLGTATLMRAVVDRENGIRTGHIISHLMFYEVPGHKLLCLTDGGMNTFPDLEKKVQILEHAARALKKFGKPDITAACVCGAEVVNPKIQSNLDAQALVEKNDYWQSTYGMTVYGPVGLDLAVSKEAVQHKHYPVDCAGEADILLVPNYEVGNGIGKAMTCFANARNAGVIVGARVPIILVSRSDSVESKLASIALGCVLSDGAEI